MRALCAIAIVLGGCSNILGIDDLRVGSDAGPDGSPGSDSATAEDAVPDGFVPQGNVLYGATWKLTQLTAMDGLVVAPDNVASLAVTVVGETRAVDTDIVSARYEFRSSNEQAFVVERMLAISSVPAIIHTPQHRGPGFAVAGPVRFDSYAAHPDALTGIYAEAGVPPNPSLSTVIVRATRNGQPVSGIAIAGPGRRVGADDLGRPRDLPVTTSSGLTYFLNAPDGTYTIMGPGVDVSGVTLTSGSVHFVELLIP